MTLSSSQIASVQSGAEGRQLANPSTFTRAVRGGASWLFTDDNNRVVMMRVSPRRVMLDLQAWAGVAPDAQYGPETRDRIDAKLLPSYPNGFTNERDRFEAALNAVYHSNAGTVTLPERVELPQSLHRPFPVIGGDATFQSALVLDPGTGAVTSDQTIPRQNTTPSSSTSRNASILSDLQNASTRLSALLSALPLPNFQGQGAPGTGGGGAPGNPAATNQTTIAGLDIGNPDAMTTALTGQPGTGGGGQPGDPGAPGAPGAPGTAMAQPIPQTQPSFLDNLGAMLGISGGGGARVGVSALGASAGAGIGGGGNAVLVAGSQPGQAGIVQPQAGWSAMSSAQKGIVVGGGLVLAGGIVALTVALVKSSESKRP